MSDHALVVSNPPQGEVDFVKAAPSFGMTPAEVRMKANYPVPEIWIADSDEQKVDLVAGALEEAGLRVISVLGDRLAAVPAAEPARSFEFGDAELTLRLENGEVTVGFEDPTVALFCQPSRPDLASRQAKRDSLGEHMSHGAGTMGGSGRRSSTNDQRGMPTALDLAAFVDIYLQQNGSVRRVSVNQETTDFSGLESAAQRSADNMLLFVTKFSERFLNSPLDKRLVGMRVRQRPALVGAIPQDNRRKGYSFATQALSRLLESVSPALTDVGDSDLASRLAYLTLTYH